MSINAFKGVEVGLGFEMAKMPAVKSMMKFFGMKNEDITGNQIVLVDLKAV